LWWICCGANADLRQIYNKSTKIHNVPECCGLVVQLVFIIIIIIITNTTTTTINIIIIIIITTTTTNCTISPRLTRGRRMSGDGRQ